MTPRVSLSITVLCFALAACKKSPVATADAGAPERIPAPTSSLARELNTDDAGRGEYRAFDDGPWCGFAPRVDRDKPLDRSPDYPPPEASWMGFFETKTAPPDGPRLYERAAISLSLTGPARAFTRKLLPLTLSLKNGSAAPFQYGLPVGKRTCRRYLPVASSRDWRGGRAGGKADGLYRSRQRPLYSRHPLFIAPR